MVKDIQTATPEVNTTELVRFNTSWWPGNMADIAGIEEEDGVEAINDTVTNGKYLLGLSNDMMGFLVMGINENGLVDRYAFISLDTLTWGPDFLGQGKPVGFELERGKQQSGFGAAFTYMLEDGTQRVFMSANSARVTEDKFCTETGESCTKNNDCTGSNNKCKRKKTDKNLGVFEIQLPLKVPEDCWNYGTDTKTHKQCDDVVPRGPNNPGGKLRLSMLSAPTGTDLCGNQPVCRVHFGNDAAVLAPSSGEEPAPPRHRRDRWRREVSISTQATTTGSTAAARASSSRPSRRRPADSRPTTT